MAHTVVANNVPPFPCSAPCAPPPPDGMSALACCRIYCRGIIPLPGSSGLSAFTALGCPPILGSSRYYSLIFLGSHCRRRGLVASGDWVSASRRASRSPSMVKRRSMKPMRPTTPRKPTPRRKTPFKQHKRTRPTLTSHRLYTSAATAFGRRRRCATTTIRIVVTAVALSAT